ncbi:MAG TPA: HepT-like ribonuclease domain-containing protein [Bacteroidales bacterium]|jgi:uncharacterized protein with HEPN domain|nr:HepT-like ribonuclease domain-containing protein [Bacteroidales bacterium]
MTDQDKKFLSDILQAIELIESFTSEIKDFDHYLSDLKTQSAVERQLGIIGDAIKSYDKLVPKTPLSNTRQIAGFRNRLIHTYDAIDQTILWTIIKRHLQPLKSEVSSRL